MNFNFIEWHSLKTRVTLFTLAIFVISIWSLAFYAGRILREELERQLGEQQLSTVSFVASEINEELEETVRVLEQEARLIDQIMLKSPATLQQMLERRPSLRAHFNGGLLVLSLDGTALADVPVSAGRRGTNYSDNEADRIALTEGKTAISGPMMGHQLKQALFNITTPIRNAQDQVIGALVGVINLGLPNFLDKVANNRYGKRGGYLIVDPKHRLLVTATDKTRVMQSVPAPGIDQLVDKRMRGFDGTEVAVNPLGVENLSSAAQIPMTGWFVVAALPTEEAFAPIRHIAQHIMVATIFLTLLAGVLTWWVLKRQLAPMLSTAKILASLSKSNQPPQPLPISRQDEIGDLISGFNHLLEILRQREGVLRASEECARLVFDRASDGIITLSPSGQLLAVNEAFARMHGYTTEEMLRLSLRDFDTPETSQLTPGRIERLLAGEAVIFEAEHFHRDGHVLTLEVSASLLVSGDEPVIQAFHRDITERKQIQAEISKLNTELEERVLARTNELHQANQSLTRAKIQAEAANIAKGSFLSNISHEIRTPLNAILGFSRLMREDPDASGKLRKAIDIISRSGEHLLALINDVLDMAKIDAGHMVIEKVTCDLGGLLDEITSMMRLRAEDKGLQLTLTQSSRLPRFVSTDASKLRQILINLIGNAIKFTEHGSVTLRMNAAPGNDSQQLLTIEVEDSGIGISAANRTKIFEPFVQVNHKKWRGTGLGLTITQRFVQLLGGRINVQSAIGKGSLFRVELPVELAQAPESNAVEIESGRVTGLAPGQSEYRILIVEDQLENSMLLAEILDLPGLQVRVAANGEQGVEMFAQWKPHLIWMDIRMPVMDGMEATQRIRAQPGGHEVKIVAVTASVFKAERDALMAASMDAIVLKPYQFGEVYHTLTTLLGVSFVHEEA